MPNPQNSSSPTSQAPTSMRKPVSLQSNQLPSSPPAKPVPISPQHAGLPSTLGQNQLEGLRQPRGTEDRSHTGSPGSASNQLDTMPYLLGHETGTEMALKTQPGTAAHLRASTKAGGLKTLEDTGLMGPSQLGLGEGLVIAEEEEEEEEDGGMRGNAPHEPAARPLLRGRKQAGKDLVRLRIRPLEGDAGGEKKECACWKVTPAKTVVKGYGSISFVVTFLPERCSGA